MTTHLLRETYPLCTPFTRKRWRTSDKLDEVKCKRCIRIHTGYSVKPRAVDARLAYTAKVHYTRGDELSYCHVAIHGTLRTGDASKVTCYSCRRRITKMRPISAKYA